MPPSLTPSSIVDMASAFYASATLFAALDLDLFGRVERGGGTTTVGQVAADAGLDRRGVTLLMDACAALGLLVKEGECYRNGEASRLCLVPGSPNDLTRAIRYNQDVYAAWGHLPRFVATGRPVEAPEIHLGADVERTRRFVLSMHGRALGIGRIVVPLLDLAGCRRLLDIGGGPGTYSVLMAQAVPGLTCRVLDLPGVVEVAAELIAAAGLTDRVSCLPGDYHTTPFPSGQDVVTIFGVLHQESPASIRDILVRAWAALRPGGRIYILDMMTDATHTAPVFSALFAVNMALTTEHGWVFSDAELRDWLEQAGFADIRRSVLSPPMPHWLVAAVKPGDAR